MMKYYEIMDGRAATGERDGYEIATCFVSCSSLRDAKRSIKSWPSDACVWETDDSIEYPASTRMVYSFGKWYV